MAFLLAKRLENQLTTQEPTNRRQLQPEQPRESTATARRQTTDRLAEL